MKKLESEEIEEIEVIQKLKKGLLKATANIRELKGIITQLNQFVKLVSSIDKKQDISRILSLPENLKKIYLELKEKFDDLNKITLKGVREWIIERADEKALPLLRQDIHDRAIKLAKGNKPPDIMLLPAKKPVLHELPPYDEIANFGKYAEKQYPTKTGTGFYIPKGVEVAIPYYENHPVYEKDGFTYTLQEMNTYRLFTTKTLREIDEGQFYFRLDKELKTRKPPQTVADFLDNDFRKIMFG